MAWLPCPRLAVRAGANCALLLEFSDRIANGCMVAQTRSAAVGRAGAGDRGDAVAARAAARQRRVAQR